jgi:hypothetical protein
MADCKPKRRIMRRFQINEISSVDEPAQQGAIMTLLKRRMHKSVAGVKFFAGDFAYVGKADDPRTWHFLLTSKPNGKPTRKMVDAAVKAYGDMMGGMEETGQPNRYHIPDDALDSLLDKIRDAWAKAYPSKDPNQMPEEIAVEPDPTAASEDEVAAAAFGEEGDEEVDPMAEGEDGTDPMAEEDDTTDPAAKPKPKPKKPPAFAAKNKLGEAILKYYYVDPSKGAMSFTQVLAECKKEEQYREVMEVAYPILNSLDGSLRSIVADKSLDTASKTTMMRSSVEGFLAAIKEEWPEVEEALEKALLNDGTATGDDDMKRAMKDAGGDENGFLKGLSTQVADLTKKFEAQTADLKKANEERDAALAKAATAEAVGKLSADFKKYYGGLATDEAKAEFLKMDEKAQRIVVAKAADEAEDTIEIDGTSFSKAEVGAGAFAILKVQAKRQATLEKQLQEEREARETAEYAKQAEDEMEHLPGDVAMKARVLRAIDQEIEDDDVREALGKMLACGNKAVTAAYQRIGTDGNTNDGDEPVGKSRVHPWETRVSAIKNRDGCTHREAMQKARDEHPDEFEDWQGTNTEA